MESWDGPVPPSPGSYANLTMASDMNTVSCTYQWGPGSPPGIQIQHIEVTVTDGPIYASDLPLVNGNSTWQVYNTDLASPNPSSFSLMGALNGAVARSYTRVLTCIVTGIDPATTFPIYLTAQPMVVQQYGQPWQPYSYPMPGSYVPSFCKYHIQIYRLLILRCL